MIKPNDTPRSPASLVIDYKTEEWISEIKSFSVENHQKKTKGTEGNHLNFGNPNEYV